MKSPLVKVSVVISLLFVAVGAIRVGAQSPESGLPNFAKVNEKLYRGGQPTVQGFDALRRLGIRTVVDLRDDDDRAGVERERVTAAGMRFVNVPLSNWFGPKDTKIDEVLRIIDAPENQPVFVHCRRGSDRTGTVIGAYRILREGWEFKRAMSEAESFGLGWWQFWMRDYLRDLARERGRRSTDDR